jgi:hypothetical protein
MIIVSTLAVVGDWLTCYVQQDKGYSIETYPPRTRNPCELNDAVEILGLEYQLGLYMR